MNRKVVLVVACCCVAVVASGAALSGCAPTIARAGVLVRSGTPTAGDPAKVPDQRFVGAINDFGVDLLTKASEDDRNVTVSPLSVHAALSMTANGASGGTAREMRQVLRTDSMSVGDANEQWASLLTQLGDRDSKQTLEIANGMWGRDDVAFKERFVATDRDYFGAELATLDFASDDVAGTINRWVKSNTRGMITRVIDEVPADAILYLANAVYFKGTWVEPFKSSRTIERAFTRADGSAVEVEMMHSTDELPYAESDTLQATRLSYSGKDSAFYVLLPKPGVKLDVAAASLGDGGFSELRREMTSEEPTKVVLGLPKLDTEFDTDLADQLEAMGMPRAFDAQRAQFSKMADLDEPIFIGRVLHKTKVRIDEKGSEAAAATVVEARVGGFPEPEPKPPVRITCDRPYLFAIVDERSGAMLFLASVNDPTE